MVLYPHTKFFGYYIDIERNEAYSIKSGRLKKLKVSKPILRSKSGKFRKIEMVTFSHMGIPKYCPRDQLHKYAEHNPKNTLRLDVKL